MRGGSARADRRGAPGRRLSGHGRGSRAIPATAGRADAAMKTWPVVLFLSLALIEPGAAARATAGRTEGASAGRTSAGFVAPRRARDARPKVRTRAPTKPRSTALGRPIPSSCPVGPSGSQIQTEPWPPPLPPPPMGYAGRVATTKSSATISGRCNSRRSPQLSRHTTA